MKSRKWGFTIVELLVVITIIALLMALIFPVLSMAREGARRTQCITNVQQLCKGAQGYAIDKGNFPPLFGSPLNGVVVGWPVYMLPRIERQDLWDQITGKGVIANAQPALQVIIPVYMCPSDPPESAGDLSPLSYAANAGMADVTGNTYLPPDWKANGVFHRFDNQGQSWQPERVDMGFIQKYEGNRNTICITENCNMVNWQGKTEPDVGVVWQLSPATAFNRDLTGACDYAHARPSSKHSGGFVTGFCDGHVNFVNEAIDYTVYARLMTPDGRTTRPANQTSPSPIGNQATVLTATELQVLQ